MAPKQNAAASGRGQLVKYKATFPKRSVAAPRGGVKPRSPIKRSYRRDLLKPIEAKVIIGASSQNAIELKSPTSYAARKRRRAGLSMAEIFAESAKEEEDLVDHAAEFQVGSTALSTWGAPTSQPVPAVRGERRNKGFRAFGLLRGKNAAFVKFMYGSDLEKDDDGDEIITPFRFLDLPLEIRWKIYGFLLIHQKPILMHSDWRTVHVNSPRDHTILRASKQVLLESTQFLYEKNVFHAVVSTKRESLGLKSNPTDGFIKKEFLPYLRNVIVECRFGWSSSPRKDDLVGPIAGCLSTLVTSGSFLDSLTLVINPVMELTDPSHSLVLTQPLVGKQIPEYFRAPSSKIMRVIPKLRCKVLNIILRMPDKNRVLVSINLRGLPVNQDKSGWFAGDRVANLRERKLARQARKDLVGLEERFEDICGDYEKAIIDGKARLMGEEESLADGMKLALRG